MQLLTLGSGDKSSEQGRRYQAYGLRYGVRFGRTAAAACHRSKQETNQQTQTDMTLRMVVRQQLGKGVQLIRKSFVNTVKLISIGL